MHTQNPAAELQMPHPSNHHPAWRCSAAGIVLALLAWQAPAAAQTKDSLAVAHEDYSAALKAQRHVEKQLEDAEKKVRSADDVAASQAAGNVMGLSQAVSAAVAEEDARQVLLAKLADAREAVSAARRRLKAQAQIAAQALSARPPATTQVLDLLDGGAKAQSVVASLKAQAAEAFQLSDEARSTALRLAHEAIKAGSAPGSDASQNAWKSIDLAKDAHASALEVSEQRDRAQAMGNRAVAAASALAECGLTNCDSLAALQVNARRTLDALGTRDSKSKKGLAAAKLFSYGVKANDMGDDPTERANALAFLQLIDANPRAKGLFGAEAATLAAGSDGTTATVRFSLNRLVSSWSQDTTLSLSAPLGSSRTLLSSAEGSEADGIKVRLAGKGWRGLKPQENLFSLYHQVGYFAEVSRSKFTVAGATLSDKDLVGIHRTNLGAGVSSLFATSELKGAHRIGFEVAKTHEGPTAETRCPATPEPIKDPVTGAVTGYQTYLKCLTAGFGDITSKWERKLSYGYRRDVGNIGFAPSVTRTLRTRHTAYDVPVYFLKGAGDDKDKLTAGVAYHYETEPNKPSVKRWEFFITSPLAVLGGD
jgi:hypothetical protein